MEERPPEEIREEIEDVREDLGETLEEIGDRVAPQKLMARAKAEAAERVEGVKAKLSPRRLARRGGDKLRQGARRAVGSGDDSASSGRVSNVAGDTGGRGRATVRSQTRPAAGAARGQSQAVAKRVKGAASSVADSMNDAPQSARQRVEGNPLAAGLLAFAGGFAAAALLPPTDRERQAAEQAKERLQPLAQGAAEVGKSVAGELQSSAKARLETVKETATEAAEEVKGRTRSSAGRVKEEASGATQTVAGRAKKATKKVQQQAKGATGAVKGQTKQAAKQVRGRAKKATAGGRAPIAARSQSGTRARAVTSASRRG